MTTNQTLNAKRSSFMFRACQRCGGDAFLDVSDEPEWRCLLCSRPVQPEAEPVSLPLAERRQKAA